MSWIPREVLESMGFAALGQNVLISEKASIYGQNKIEIGSNVRIDDFVVLSAGEGGFKIGNHVHIATQACMIGAAPIELCDFCAISSKVSIFSSSDDYTGRGMTNPTVPEKFRRVKHISVVIGRHAIVGANSVILPGSRLSEGTSVGALSVVSKVLDPWSIYLGNPIKKLLKRSKALLNLEKKLLDESRNGYEK